MVPSATGLRQYLLAQFIGERYFYAGGSLATVDLYTSTVLQPLAPFYCTITNAKAIGNLTFRIKLAGLGATQSQEVHRQLQRACGQMQPSHLPPAQALATR